LSRVSDAALSLLITWPVDLFLNLEDVMSIENEKLIAAAPALLSACKKAIDVLDINGGGTTNEVWAEDLLQILRDAINKAECDDQDNVVRYVLTHLSDDGEDRVLIGPAQGRFTYRTEKLAQAAVTQVHKNNPPGLVEETFNLPIEVRPCNCWTVSFDPKQVRFDK